jgi:hypothetical protein
MPHKRGRVRSHVFCHAPHPDPAKPPGTPCETFLGHVPAVLEFMTTADSCPAEPDLTVWLKCTRRHCGKWNRFRIVPP